MIDRFLILPFESKIYLQNFDMPKCRIIILQHLVWTHLAWDFSDLAGGHLACDFSIPPPPVSREISYINYESSLRWEQVYARYSPGPKNGFQLRIFEKTAYLQSSECLSEGKRKVSECAFTSAKIIKLRERYMKKLNPTFQLSSIK